MTGECRRVEIDTAKKSRTSKVGMTRECPQPEIDPAGIQKTLEKDDAIKPRAVEVDGVPRVRERSLIVTDTRSEGAVKLTLFCRVERCEFRCRKAIFEEVCALLLAQ